MTTGGKATMALFVITCQEEKIVPLKEGYGSLLVLALDAAYAIWKHDDLREKYAKVFETEMKFEPLWIKRFFMALCQCAWDEVETNQTIQREGVNALLPKTTPDAETPAPPPPPPPSAQGPTIQW
jgi:hypothetical protein